jgi:hypothetical protein
MIGRAVAQAVRPRLPTPAARVRVRAAYVDFGGQSGSGEVLSKYFHFPCQSFHKFLHYRDHPGMAQ